MINKLPKDIIGYMIDNIPPFTGIAIIKSDNAGKITGYYGSFDKYIDNFPEKGTQIQDVFPFFEGMIPLPQKSLLLPNMQVSGDTFADIHIVLNDDNSHWFFFMDRTQNVESIREIIQEMNENKLKTEREKKEYCFEKSSK